jgi:hypothetical protein
MAEGCVHTVCSGGRWRNKVEGDVPLPGWYDRQEIAAEAGRSWAIRRRAEHVIRNEDGTIARRDSYRADPAFPELGAEAANETGLAYAMRRLVGYLVHERDGSVPERTAADRRGAGRGGGTTAVRTAGEGLPGR